MILQELTRLYERLLDNPDIDVCEPGFSKENISIKLVIDGHGNVTASPQSLGDKANPVRLTVPKFDGKRTSGLKANFLWDKSDYVIGYDKNGKECPEERKLFTERIKQVRDISGMNHKILDAVEKFIHNDTALQRLKTDSSWPELLGKFLVFEVEGFGNYVFENDIVRQIWKMFYERYPEGKLGQTLYEGRCLVTGEKKPIAEKHPTIKGKSELAFVSCNTNKSPAFASYGLEGTQNSPVSVRTASRFSNTLNYIKSDKNFRIMLNDMTVLFWSGLPLELNSTWLSIFEEDNSVTESIEEVRHFLQAIKKGKLPDDIDETASFFVLGIVPGTGRYTVKLWLKSNVRDFLYNYYKHYRDSKICGERSPSLRRLLRQLVEREDDKKMNSSFNAQMIKAIVFGHKYPSNFLPLLIERIRRESDKVNYYRASFIKAILNRNFNKELTMPLDMTRTSIPYCLGRLFAVLEKTQKDASGKDRNATIKDRYFASASATPKVVFPLLIRLVQNHLKTIKSSKPGMAVNREKLIGEIMDKLNDFPATLKLEEQGEFAIGYYHQRYYKKPDVSTDNSVYNNEATEE